MSKRLVIHAALALPLALAGCGDKADKQAQAGGEVLPGSASDAMLPLDTATSKPPLAPRTVDSEAKGNASEAAAEPVAEPAPAEPAKQD